MYASYSPARSGRAVNSRDFVSTISGATVSLYNEVHVSTSSTASPMTTPSKLNRTEESPLLKGSLYSRVQGETFHGHDDLHVTSLTLAQLYSHAYVPYVQRQQAEALSSSSPPSRPLEFDGETPVSIEDARQYIRDLAVMYRTKFRDPTPCQLYEELVRRAMESGMAEDKAVSGRSEEDLTTDDQPPALWLPKGYGGMVDSSLRCHRVTPSAEVLTHAMSFWLLSIKDVTNPECVIESIKQSKGEVLTLFPSVVMRCLGFVREVVRDDNVSSGRKGTLCSLLGFVVAPRKI
ncbi:unnamed protein product [Trypanosoma congolense IL3000]|uniref:WGS project CAEQ00000000 data, annotated contig 1729 n=1 Tax=Trypanosoma congolense (strain IL3000) TaxID=1068625 RepID=F9W8D2_TRYCI|nr:unnamed protein product [Trypanosoma congolense IL3000]